MRNIDRYKEIYELWVKYLEKSPRYREFCIDQRDHEPSSVFRRKRIQRRRFNRGYWNIRDVYEFFGDIHSSEYNFDEWWNNTMLPLLREYSSDARAIGKIDKKINQYAAEIKEELSSLAKQGDEAITVEKIENFLNKFFWSKVGPLLSQMGTCTSKTLEAKLTSVMNDEKKQSTKMTKPTSLFIPIITPNKLFKEKDIEALKRYLTVYEYRHEEPKIKYEKIAETFARDEDREWDGTIVDYKRSNYVTENTYAERIVKNTERGLFPGTYHKKRSKKKR